MKKSISAFIVLSFFFSADVVFAQRDQSSGVGVSPVTFELTANPGDTIGNKIKVHNPTNGAVSVKMEVEDFLPVGEEGGVVTTTEEDEDTTYSLRRWITVLPSEFTLEKGERKEIDFVVEVPKDAEPGGKYGSILAGITNSTEGTYSASVVSKTGALVLLTVAGDVKENLIAKNFSAPSFQEYGPILFELKFENEGTVHVKPMGYIVVTDWFGNKAIELELSRKNVMPGAVRKVDVNWDTKWLFGKYTATLVGSYGASNTPLEPYVITFTVFPWKLALGILIVLIIIFTILFLSRKRLKLAAKILFKGEHHAIGNLPKA